MSKEAYQEAINRIDHKLFDLAEIRCDDYSGADVDAVRTYVTELLKEVEEWRAFKAKTKDAWTEAVEKIMLERKS